MALFDIPQRAGKSTDNVLAKKSNSKNKQTTTIKGGSTLLDSIAMANALVEKNLGKFKDEYAIIQEEKELVDYIDKSINNGIISIDTETTGLDPISDKLVGICIYTPDMKPAYIPVNHISYITNMRVDNQLNPDFLTLQFNRLKENIKIIMFNAKFDIRVLRNQLNVYLTCYWDCYLAGRLMNENEPSKGLKALHQKYVLNGKEDEFSFGKLFNNITFDKIPIKTGYLYAAHDAIVTYELYEFQKQYLRLDSDREDLRHIAEVFFNIEMPCINVVADMEDIGVDFDFEYNKELSVKYNAKLDEKRACFYKECNMYADEIRAYRNANKDCKLDEPINIASTTQIAILLYDIMKLEQPVDKKTKKATRGTGEEILKSFGNTICNAILEYRTIEKLVGTYIDKLPDCVNTKDNRIHCSFNQYGADTGRFSSSDPNLQNIPSHNKDIRKMFKATDGYVLMSSDYSQQEPKVMTQMCGDEKMIQAYKEGKDLYAEIAAMSFNTTYDNCLEFRADGTTNKEGKERRSSAKSILLGVLYGRGVPSIAEQLNTTTQKAQEIKDRVFKGFPAIPRFEKESLDMAYYEGYVTTLWGRKRRLPDMQLDEYEFKWVDGVKPDDDLLDFDDELSTEVPEDLQQKYLRKLASCRFNEKRKIFEQANAEGIWIIDNGKKIADASRQCVNARIQGSAADMSKLAMIKVGTDKRLKELGFRLLIPVHDELIAECPEENAKECAERFAHLMSIAAEDKLHIPINCDVEITKQWYGEKVNIDA